MFKEIMEGKVVLFGILNFIREPNYSEVLSEVSKVLKLLIVLLATNAECERGFSTLGRIKNCPRNRMKQERLNKLILRIYTKEKTKKLSLVEVANEFASKNDRRRAHFGNEKFM